MHEEVNTLKRQPRLLLCTIYYWRFFLSGILELGKNSSFFIRCIHGISEKIQKSSEIRHNQRRVGRNENIITELHP